MAAIEEHKVLITSEYKSLRRELDIEKGNLGSQIKLAKKENRSSKHIDQLAKMVCLTFPMLLIFENCVYHNSEV